MSSYELVYQKLRENILNGHYKHGDELRETAVGKEIGVSRTPVREALRQLELEGLVTIIPNRGAFVNGISEQDVQDIYLIRARLEGLCARMAAERIDESTLEEMEETMMLTAFHEEQGHYDQLFKLDSRFHSLLYEACKSKILEHVMEAIKAHNADEADRLATRHILNSIKNHHYTKIEKLLEEQPGGDVSSDEE